MTAQAHPIPAELAPVLAFVNSLDVELGADDWADGPAALGRWLVTAGLAGAGVQVTRPQYALAQELRRGLRVLALGNNQVPPAPAEVDRLRRTLGAFPLVVQPDASGGGTLAGAGDRDRPVPLAALDRVVAGYTVALLTGQWRRLRQCPASDCGWIFWDSSAKGARRWCTMGACGNRAKARAFATRRRAAPVPAGDQ